MKKLKGKLATLTFKTQKNWKGNQMKLSRPNQVTSTASAQNKNFLDVKQNHTSFIVFHSTVKQDVTV